jgi:glycosyltransferase involved in cell wall biosynthesis
MKIGLVIDYFKPHAIGGAERSTGELARALVERGHDVTVLTPNYGAPPEEKDEGVRICRYWFPRRIEPGRIAPAFWIKNPLYYRLSAREIVRIARRLEIEILHAQNTFVQTATYRAARRLGIPCVATVRDLGSLCSVGHLCSVGYDPEHICSKSFFRCAREFADCYHSRAGLGFRIRFVFDTLFKQVDLIGRQRILRRYSRIIFVSHGLKDEYLRRGFRAQAERLAVAYNLPPNVPAMNNKEGSPPPEWRLPETAPIVTYAGKLSLGKGAHVLFEAIPRVVERRPDVVFVFAGRPTPQVEIPTTIPDCNLRVLGQIPPQQVYALLKRSSLFVLPSVWPEPLSSAVLEALAFGVPVVGTKCGGTPEQIVDGENGLLVKRGDHAALAEAILKALANANALRRMSERCQTVLRERFDPDGIISEMLAIYASAIAECERTRPQ